MNPRQEETLAGRIAAQMQCLLAAILCLISQSMPAADNVELPGQELNWLKGPAKASMQSIAEIDVPAGYVFADGDGARKLMDSMGNLTSGTEVGFLAPTNLSWFILFRFSKDGYVKDDDKDKLNADAMLKTIQRGAEIGNKERKRRGLPQMTVVGWEQKPAYDPVTHNLEWAIRGESEGESVINYNTRILGRKGVMEVKLVLDPGQLAATLPQFKQMLTSYQYKTGERYAEYRPGDKIAQYGLTALVIGGAAAGAAKLGLFAWLAVFFKKAWKLVVVVVVAIGAFFKRIIVGRSAPRMND